MIKNFVVLLFLLINTDGFSPSSVAPRVSQLNLLPEQGNQLAAACEASFTHHPDDDLSQKQCSTSAARKFVARIFSLPSSLFHPHPAEQVEKDIVYYPIVGFQYVAGCSKPLPPTMPKTSCRIQPPEEELFGWYSPACHLPDPDSDDYPFDEFTV